jgi:hypothetical protein
VAATGDVHAGVPFNLVEVATATATAKDGQYLNSGASKDAFARPYLKCWHDLEDNKEIYCNHKPSNSAGPGAGDITPLTCPTNRKILARNIQLDRTGLLNLVSVCNIINSLPANCAKLIPKKLRALQSDM